MGLDTKTYWLTDCQSQCDFDFDFDFDLQLLREQLRFSRCELLLLEVGSWDRGHFGNSEEEEHQPLEAATKNWLLKT
jgi:hypothetical protein